MTYVVNAFIVLFILGLTSAGWYWLFKRFERRMSERFNDVSGRENENFSLLSMIIEDLSTMHKKLDLLQGLLLVIKQDRAIDAALRDGQVYCEKGAISAEEFNKFTRLLRDLRLENLSRY